ncbi:hypothetical protein SKAU_G00179180 [Synaphobranchus kaupii]|uniref:Chemokine interleukin-8-like domain-containing protein n=1 Tax=Synaphobranchus kaupii TaxID=118154 RepID=A0A9Q1FMA0_SYNKA|nr:hypothetical protein SKAU_G00179180 [Synaphobranchus kaupii]
MKYDCLHTPAAVLAFALCILLYKAQVGASTFVPIRCSCPATYKAVRGPFIDFSVIRKGPHCITHEIIVRLKRTNKEVCLSPEGRQAKRLLRCWNRINKNGGNKRKCLRPRAQKKPQQRKRPGKTKGTTS